MRMASAASEFIEGDFYTDSDIRDLEDVDADREAFVQRSPDIKANIFLSAPAWSDVFLRLGYTGHLK